MPIAPDIHALIIMPNCHLAARERYAIAEPRPTTARCQRTCVCGMITPDRFCQYQRDLGDHRVISAIIVKETLFLISAFKDGANYSAAGFNAVGCVG